MNILFWSITSTNLGQLSKPGTDLKSAGSDIFKTPPTYPIWYVEVKDIYLSVYLSQKCNICTIILLHFKKIKEWYHVSLTSNISAKTWSNCTCRGCFENVRTSRFQICPWFWKWTKICGSNRAKQNTTDFFPLLYLYGTMEWM